MGYHIQVENNYSFYIFLDTDNLELNILNQHQALILKAHIKHSFSGKIPLPQILGIKHAVWASLGFESTDGRWMAS